MSMEHEHEQDLFPLVAVEYTMQTLPLLCPLTQAVPDTLHTVQVLPTIHHLLLPVALLLLLVFREAQLKHGITGYPVVVVKAEVHIVTTALPLLLLMLLLLLLPWV